MARHTDTYGGAARGFIHGAEDTPYAEDAPRARSDVCAVWVPADPTLALALRSSGALPLALRVGTDAARAAAGELWGGKAAARRALRGFRVT